jgi:hypothetical protein
VVEEKILRIEDVFLSRKSSVGKVALNKEDINV